MTIHRTLVFSDAVTRTFLYSVVWLEDSFIVAVDERFDIFRAAVTHLDVFSVKQFMKFVSFRKVFIDESKEFSANVCGY